MSSGGDAGKIETLASGAMKPFDMRIIEQALRDLWKEGAEAGAAQKQAAMRACVLNLIIYEDNPEEASKLTETIIDVTKHHPGRLLMMSTKPDAQQETLLADVSA